MPDLSRFPFDIESFIGVGDYIVISVKVLDINMISWITSTLVANIAKFQRLATLK
jgi:hypothetical protein